jgi:2'-5' RNA ligase
VSDDAAPTGSLLVLTPSVADPVNALSEEDAAHVTLLWFGDDGLEEDTAAGIREHVRAVVLTRGEFDAKVSGRAELGDNLAGVLLIESIELMELRDDLFDNPYVQRAWEAADQFPAFVPHLTLRYGGGIPSGELPASVHFDGVGFWQAGQHEPFPLRRSSIVLDDPNFRTDYDYETEALAGSIIPPVETADDLPLCVQFALQHPGARWYAERRASALGLAELIPAGWAVPA